MNGPILQQTPAGSPIDSNRDLAVAGPQRGHLSIATAPSRWAGPQRGHLSIVTATYILIYSNIFFAPVVWAKPIRSDV
jgi:hypothetical protein